MIEVKEKVSTIEPEVPTLEPEVPEEENKNKTVKIFVGGVLYSMSNNSGNYQYMISGIPVGKEYVPIVCLVGLEQAAHVEGWGRPESEWF